MRKLVKQLTFFGSRSTLLKELEREVNNGFLRFQELKIAEM